LISWEVNEVLKSGDERCFVATPTLKKRAPCSSPTPRVTTLTEPVVTGGGRHLLPDYTNVYCYVAVTDGTWLNVTRRG